MSKNVKNVKMSKNVKKIQKYCQIVKLSIQSWRSRTRSRRKGRSGEEEDEEGDKQEEKADKEEEKEGEEKEKEEEVKEKEEKMTWRKKIHRKGKIYSLKTFPPRTFLLTYVLYTPMYSSLASTCLLNFSQNLTNEKLAFQ